MAKTPESGRNIQLPIYMDYQATTPTDPRVVEEMLPYFTTKFGNPHSRSHQFGWESEEAVEIARGQVAALIGASDKEIIFTSGATESNNLAIKGVAEMYAEKGNHIITLATEHKATLDTCKRLEKHGIQVTYLPVEANGLVDLDKLKAAITDKTILISIMYANNEIGTIQPIAELAQIAHERDDRIKRLTGKIDRVLVDAPCSGLGTLRRNPDLKWRQSPQAIEQLQKKQLAILGSASRLVKPGGRLVYATCSVIPAENEDVAALFASEHPDFVQLDARAVLEQAGVTQAESLVTQAGHLRLWPHRHATDGFYAVAWEKKA